MISENLLHCDSEYMEETPCENEPTRDDGHVEREVATLQKDSDSVEIIVDKVLVDCELVEEEFISIFSLPQLNYEDVRIDHVKECRNKLNIILWEQFTAQNEAKKERKEWVLHIFSEEFDLMGSIKNPKERK
ncbi:hypothetical protein RND71_006740 [Anisodus tanguticus]|uniref:Uncharacterized protein n=1 Tax=Anisodus tanguticus TaxID=243964 RepID=A0AAE1SRD0_9SOLA|nr:hypothetical protein RND71_006740 [Anisodus tanguticus]